MGQLRHKLEASSENQKVIFVEAEDFLQEAGLYVHKFLQSIRVSHMDLLELHIYRSSRACLWLMQHSIGNEFHNGYHFI